MLTPGCISAPVRRLFQRGASRYPNGRYRLHIFPRLQFEKGTSIIEITQRCWDQIEPVVRQNPSPWVWMYKHWRYRLAGSAKPYPFYAERGPKFEARLNAAMEKLQREVVP